jgi:membrane-associated protein
MDLISFFIDFILHLDTHLSSIINSYGVWTYAILFAIVFCETGLVFTPFLPGDSLLFAAGTFAALGALNLGSLLVVLACAAILGDTVNYAVGHYIGMKLFKRYPRILKKEYLTKTHAFYEKYGGKTIIFARFVPIVRTFAPFVAGLGAMTYKRFITYNIIGGALWVALFVCGGYLFGNIPLVQHNFTLVIFAIIIISFIPAIYEFFKHRRLAHKV